MAKKRKIKIPKSVLDLRISPKKFAKKHNIKLKGKGMSKREKKHNKKRLDKEYSEFAINGLNKAVKIIAENPIESKKIDKVKEGIDNIISSPSTMKKIIKLYKKHPDSYPHMVFLPNMIMNTIFYYKQEDLDDEEKEIGNKLDDIALIKFCEKILKKEIKRYCKMGINKNVAFQLSTIIPTNKILKNNRQWYKKLIQKLYEIAKNEEINVDDILRAVIKLDKKKGIGKKEFLEGFFSEFILQKNSNKNHSFNESQKDLHEALIDRTLSYLNDLKSRKLREILKTYIKRRKTAESYKNDTKRVIKFVDHANGNSPYETIKKVVQGLIADNSSNELYLS